MSITMDNPPVKYVRLSERALIATNYVGVASYVVLIYDHFLTFPDEVKFMWKGTKGPITYLFFFNRYFFPFAFIINLFAYLSPTLTPSKCHRFVRYEGACVVIGLAIAGFVMVLRVNALYQGSRRIQVFLGTIWIGMLSVYIWLLSSGYPVPRLRGEYGCSMIFSARFNGWAALSSAAPLAFDSCIVGLTLYRTWSVVRSRLASRLVRTLYKDGIIYYGTIFATNLALTIMIVTAPPGLRNILGQFAEVITVTMISRLCIHLRKVGSETTTVLGDNSGSGFTTMKKTRTTRRGTGASEMETQVSEHGLAFLKPSGHKSDQQTSSPTSASSSNRFSDCTMYSVGGVFGSASNSEGISDWKGKGKACRGSSPSILGNSDLETGQGSDCNLGENIDEEGSSRGPSAVSEDWDADANVLANEVQRDASESGSSTLELVRLIRGLRQLIYPSESV